MWVDVLIVLIKTAYLIAGVLALTLLPESPRWLASRRSTARAAEGKAEKAKGPNPLHELFRPPLLRITVIGILIATLGAIDASRSAISICG